MATTREIHPKYLPTRPPTLATAVAWLLMDRYRPPGWAWGAVGCFLALGWLAWLIALARAEWVHPREV